MRTPSVPVEPRRRHATTTPAAATATTSHAVGIRLWRTKSHGSVAAATSTAVTTSVRRSRLSHAAITSTVSDSPSDSDSLAASQLVTTVVHPRAPRTAATTSLEVRSWNQAAALSASAAQQAAPTSAWPTTRPRLVPGISQ